MPDKVIIQGRDIVVVGLQPWDTEIGSNCKDVALEFSKHNRVLYVNYPLDRNTLRRNKDQPGIQKRVNVITGKEDGLVPIGKNMWNLYPDIMAESINWINNFSVFDFLNKMNNKRLAGSIRKAMQKLGFKNIILFNDNDFMRSYYLNDLLRPTTSLFYFRDYLLGVDYWKKHGVKLEPGIISRWDICCTNSPYFRDYSLQFNKNSFYVGQGCDVEAFSGYNKNEVPETIKKLKGPVIGYVGALQNIRLDLELIGNLAKQRPSWNIVLVGPEDDVFKASNLHQIPNIIFTGGKPVPELPSWIYSFDVCLNPQIINEITIGNYPRKIDEYLAMGKPVVATATGLMQEVFAMHTYLAKTREEYVQQVEKALKEDNEMLQKERRAFAASHSWENHVKEMYSIINRFEQGITTN